MVGEQLAFGSVDVQCAGEDKSNIFDRYRAPALRVLCKDKSIEKLLRKNWFRKLVEQSGFSVGHFHLVPDNSAPWLREMATETEIFQQLKQEFPSLAQISESLNLLPHEQLIFAFIATIRDDKFWSRLENRIGDVSYGRAIETLSELLQIDAKQAALALNPRGRLISSGLLKISIPKWAKAPLSCVFSVHHEIDAAMLRNPKAWEEFFTSKFDLVNYDDEHIDFTHLEEDIELIIQVIRSSLQQRSPGTHVLLHGPPGTGKTTLARDLANRINLDLFEVRKENAGMHENDGERRFGVYNLGQRLGVAKADCLILFDEMEDLLPSSVDRLAGSTNRLHKGWICDSLEKTGLPTIWTANRLSGVDPAILRRMTVTLEVLAPPRSQRRKLLQHSFNGKNIRPEWLDRTARLQQVTPALTAQMGRLASALPQDGMQLEIAIDRWLGERLSLQGVASLPPVREDQRFRCDLLNADLDTEGLIEGLKCSGEGRICLQGPPGTGKTAFAKYLAETLDREPLVRRGSDLRSPWVGETEQNIARMFREASRARTVLILDEADSFLGSRDSSHFNWEMNETSEFLVQLENFGGIFVATTNRFEHLDRAFIRRFDFKLKLDFMSVKQRIIFFAEMVGRDISQHTREALAGLCTLTPGDFAAARRQLRFASREMGEENLLSALVHETSCKHEIEGRPIGFNWK